MRTLITCKQRFYYKSLLNLAWLWGRAWLAVNKTQVYFLLTDHQLAEKTDSVLILVSTKRLFFNLWIFVAILLTHCFLETDYMREIDPILVHLNIPNIGCSGPFQICLSYWLCSKCFAQDCMRTIWL